RPGARPPAARAGLAPAGERRAARARGTAEATDHYVHEQPWRAIAVGATLGLLLGFALARR
ncbi:MAG: glycine zipper domain-containing protein, partial [Pseudomonadota bacterium]